MGEPTPLAKATSYEVGVAVVQLRDGLPIDAGPAATADADDIPGYSPTFGRKADSGTGPATILIRKGEDVLASATAALGRQIATIAAQIAEAIDSSDLPAARPEELHLDSVQVSFGITLSAGIQTVFTTQAQSSAQVTLTLSRQAARPDDVGA